MQAQFDPKNWSTYSYTKSPAKFLEIFLNIHWTSKNQVLYLFYLFKLKKGTNTSFSTFSMDPKSQNWIKISNFLTILEITQKVIIIEEWTKNLENLVLSYGQIKK